MAGPGGGSARGARVEGHDRRARRRVVGIEGAIVDHATHIIGSFEPGDNRHIELKVAGPAALLVAKVYKIHDRMNNAARRFDKDALDVYRLLVGFDTEEIGAGFDAMLADDKAAAVAGNGIDLLRELFGTDSSQGVAMIERALEVVGEQDVAAAATVELVGDLLGHLASRTP